MENQRLPSHATLSLPPVTIGLDLDQADLDLVAHQCELGRHGGGPRRCTSSPASSIAVVMLLDDKEWVAGDRIGGASPKVSHRWCPGCMGW
jgi:hypothetical protein